jgi:uncharacterized membrane protein
MFLFFIINVSASILVCLQVSFVLVWMCYTIQGVSVLCVVSVVTMIVVGTDISVHDIENV